MSPGESALMLLPGRSFCTLSPHQLLTLPVGVGVILAMFVCLWYDRLLAKQKAQGKAWASREEYRRLPLVCLGGPLNAASQFWLARNLFLTTSSRPKKCFLELTKFPSRPGQPAHRSTGPSLCSPASSSVWV